MDCPRCAGELDAWEGFMVCWHGYFVSREALEARYGPTLRRLEKAPEGAPGPPCPACRCTMGTHKASLEVDLCPTCGGLWLDSDERSFLSEQPTRPDVFWGAVDLARHVLRVI